MSTKAQQEAIAIKADRDGERPIVLHPEDDDLFVRTGKQVIEACRLGISVDLWLNELGAMLQAVKEWVKPKSSIQAVWCAPTGARTVLFFIPNLSRFDFDLADELTALNMELVRKFNIGMVEVRQIPSSELDRFLDPASAKQIHGGQPTAHSTVEA